MRRSIPILALLLAALTAHVLAQTKTDRQLLTEALATITAIRDRLPADPVPVPDPPPVPDPVPSGKLLMSSNWETATGCNGPALFDSGGWSDYGGSGACSGSVHDADVVSDVFKVGKNSLRITQKPPPAGSSGIWNGTDFREVRTFGNQTDVTLIAWLRYHSAWHWANADHKIFIFTASDGATPNVYINFRGGTDAKHGRLCAYSTPVDVFFCAAPPVIAEGSAPTQVTVGLWYRLRVHVVAGAHGKVEMWLQPDGQAEIKLNLVYDAGAPQANINDLNVGAIGGIKLDTTYNAGTSITAPMFMWYDSVQVFAGLVQ